MHTKNTTEQVRQSVSKVAFLSTEKQQ